MMINHLIHARNNKKLKAYGFTNPIRETKMSEENEVPEGYKKVEDGEIFKFEKEGDKVEGVLIGVEDSKQFDNKVYRIKQKDESVKIVFGTVILDSKMSGVNIGSEVIIMFSGTKENEKKGQNDTKLFDVFVK